MFNYLSMALNNSAQKAIFKAAKIIKKARYVTAMTGAGISVESGIRPFRGPGGLWTERGEPPMNGYEKFLADPKKYWEEALSVGIVQKWRVNEVKPNSGHIAFAEMERIGVLKSLITQNVDDLHNKAGSKNLIEIHGNANMFRCIKCGKRYKREEIKLNVIPPLCLACGGIIKGDTVMFGEPIPQESLMRCYNEAEKSDCMIVAGTTAIVYPAAGFPAIVKRKGGYIIEINPNETILSSISDITIRGASGIALPALLKEIMK